MGWSGPGGFASDAKQRAEGVERIESSIKPKGVLVEVGLQVLRADAVVGAEQPSLQVGEDEMDYRQVLLGNSRIAPFRDRVMVIPARSDICVSGPVVGDDLRPRLDGVFDEAAQRCSAAVRNDGESFSLNKHA